MSGDTAAKYLYDMSEGDATMRTILGGKGANLAEMKRLGFPVPDGFTVSTTACVATMETRGEWPEGLWDDVLAAGRRWDVVLDAPGALRFAAVRAALTDDGRFAEERVLVRQRHNEVDVVPAADVDYMDVSPRQMVSVATALIPFLEHDDANRALIAGWVRAWRGRAVEALAPVAALALDGEAPGILAGVTEAFDARCAKLGVLGPGA